MHSPLSILRRKATATLGLALFVMGSHYCLVGALMPGGMTAMACALPVSAQAETDAHAGMPACHRGAAQTQGEEEPAPSVTLPCCTAVTPVVAPQIEKFGADGGMLLLPVLDVVVVLEAPAPSGERLRAPPDTPPNPAPPRAHTPPRAPPAA